MSIAPKDDIDLVRELRLHQVELEVQNEELRRTQAELSRSRARYQELYDLAPVGYLALDGDGKILEANLRGAAMLRTPRSALVGLPITRFIVPEDQDTYYLHTRRLPDTGTPMACELRLKQAGEESLWVSVQTSLAGGGEHGGRIHRTTLSDISEARELRVRLAQRDRLASMGLLAAGVAHEINNPLTYLIHNLKMLERGLTSLSGAADARTRSQLADLADRAAHASEGAQRIKNIARGLGSLGRLEQGDAAMVDLSEITRVAVEMAAHKIREVAELEIELATVPPIRAAEGELVQVLLNLLVNAAQAIDGGNVRGNRIAARTWASETHVFAEVTDSGAGMTRETRRRIFDPFFTTKPRGRGTGLGLAIASRIVDDLGGHIGVESEVGRRTRFVVKLPIKRDDP